eukprot:4103466-Amphidinium_carterae.1
MSQRVLREVLCAARSAVYWYLRVVGHRRAARSGSERVLRELDTMFLVFHCSVMYSMTLIMMLQAKVEEDVRLDCCSSTLLESYQ